MDRSCLVRWFFCFLRCWPGLKSPGCSTKLDCPRWIRCHSWMTRWRHQPTIWCHQGCRKGCVSLFLHHVLESNSHTLKILTLNVFYCQYPARDQRLEAIAYFDILLPGKMGKDKTVSFSNPVKYLTWKYLLSILLKKGHGFFRSFFFSFLKFLLCLIVHSRRNELALSTFCSEILAILRSSLIYFC